MLATSSILCESVADMVIKPVRCVDDLLERKVSTGRAKSVQLKNNSRSNWSAHDLVIGKGVEW